MVSDYRRGLLKCVCAVDAGAGKNLVKAHNTAAGKYFFCSKLRAPHRGTSLGLFVCGAVAEKTE